MNLTFPGHKVNVVGQLIEGHLLCMNGVLN